jgi:hypothetical protein
MNPVDDQSDPDCNPSRRQSPRLTVLRALCMLVAAGGLLLFSRLVTQAPCWGFFVVIGLLAWPIWRYRTEYVLLRRRLMLSAVTRPQSRVRDWLWRGRISKAVQVVVSMLLAWLLLVLVSQLSILHGAVLAADAVLLAVIIAPVSRRLSGAITERHINTVARHWPLFMINGVVLTAAIMVLDFFLVGAVDSRHMAWHRVAVGAFTEINEAAGCVLWGVTAGLLSAVEALAWHVSQLIIPRLPDLTAQAIAWSLFLLRAATLAYVFTALLLGVGVLLERRPERRQSGAGARTFSRAFFLTIIILAAPFFYAAVKLNALDPQILETGVEGAAGWINPCKPNEAARRSLITRLDERLEATRRRAAADIDIQVEAGLDKVFSEVEEGVDGFLDWYFTVHGEYQRLASVFTTDVAATMRDKLEEHLFARADFDVRFARLERDLEDGSARHFSALSPQFRAEVEAAPCDVGAIALTPLGDLDRDTLRASAAATSGMGAGLVASKVLAQKTAAAVAAKLAAKKSFQTGTALASKTLAKKGSSSLLSAGLGTALCAPSGPVAIVCGITAGVVTWLSVDKALIELDETLNREAMRADLLEVLAGEKAALAEQLKQKHHARVDHMAASVNDAVRRTFVPYKEGMD